VINKVQYVICTWNHLQ